VYVNQDVPEPELAPGNVIQDASLVADQEQPMPVVMNALLETLPYPSETAVGERLYEHALWFTVKVCPAIVAVPLLDVVPVFAATLSETAPAPLPVCPDAMVIQGVSLTAVQLQPLPANT
jgi:hypothetical protein